MSVVDMTVSFRCTFMELFVLQNNRCQLERCVTPPPNHPLPPLYNFAAPNSYNIISLNHGRQQEESQ